MADQPYHKYVFDTKNRTFVGDFEGMYANEDAGNYDSWHQEDMAHLGRQLSYLIISRYNFGSILDIGCGKGAFTHLLKKVNNRVTGADISATAVAKAKSKYGDVEFIRATAEEALHLPSEWDLVVMMETLSYIKDWKKVLASAAKKSSHIFVSLYLPPDPIGYVKSFADLKAGIGTYFVIETELLWNGETIYLFGTRHDKDR